MGAPRFRWMAAAAIVVMVAATSSATPGAAAPPIFMETASPAPGPRGSIAVIGDSVMLGSVWETGGYGPSLGSMLAGDGWGPVVSKAGVGVQTGRFLPASSGANMATWITNRRRLGWDAGTFVINLGANEVSSCFGSVECAVLSIDGFLDVIGPGRQVWWAKITMPDPADAATWNNALDIVAARRPELVVWDWPAVISSSGIPMSTDGVHLPTPSAYRTRSRLIADDVALRRGFALPIGQSAALPAAASGEPVAYTPLPPERVLDTRVTNGRLSGETVHTLDLSGKVPEDATAVSVNIAADDPATAGFLTAWPCDAPRPTTSSLNVTAHAARGAHALVALDEARRLCVFSSTATELIVDLQGVFSPSSVDRFDPATPQRLADTRQSGRASVVRVPAPDGATAVSLNITATGAELPGYLTAFPCGGTLPTVASVNFGAGETVGGAAFVPVGATGEVCVFSNTPTDVIVDLTGSFSPTGALRFVPGVPGRMLDTRDGTGGWTGRLGQGQLIELPVAPDAAEAVSGTLTMVDPALDAHLTTYPCATAALPPTASLNAGRAGVVANSVTVGISPQLCVQAAVNTHVVFDTTGWWLP